MKNKDYLFNALEKSAFKLKGSKMDRIRKSPIRFPYSKILQIIAIYFEKPFKLRAKTFWGQDMWGVIPDEVFLNIYRYGFFEKELTKIFIEYLKPGMTFFDIGSHFGYFTLLASFLTGNEGQVHSFEPTPSTFDILSLNASHNKNIFLNNYAVLSENKNVFLNDCGFRYPAYNSIYEAKLPKKVISGLNLKRYEVKGISIDNYVESKGVTPNFVKIDAESAEYEILIGMENTIVSYHPIISIEVGDIGSTDIPKSRDAINFLVQKHYQPYEFKNGKILKHDLKKDQYLYDNILFLPEY